jgi:hypothetical protein
MKRQLILFLFLSICLIMSCSNNKLKSNEKKLKEEILLTEKKKEQTLFAEQEKALSEKLAKQPNGFRYNEDRSADPSHPPVVINLAGNIQNKKKLRLSDVAFSIQYVRLEPLPDKSMECEMKCKYYLMDSFIVAQDLNGIQLFSKNGKYLRTIIKNEYTGVELTTNQIMISFDNYTFKGSADAWSRGNYFYYTYRNSFTGQNYIMEYDCSGNELPPAKFDPENPKKVSGMGKVYIDLNHGYDKPTVPDKNKHFMASFGPDHLYGSLGIFAPDKNCYVEKLRGNYMLGIYDNAGDTLTKFTMFEKLKNYRKQIMRGTDNGTNYQVKGKMYFRSAFNDTVFQVILPNKLFPVYVLKLGTYKVTKQQGVDPGFDLNGKIIPGDWAESKNFIYMTFTKNNYDCPNNRKNKKVEIYYAIFFKNNQNLFIIDTDPFNYEPNILENNLDGGVPVWPKAYMIGNNGEILVSLKGSEIKRHITSSLFTKNLAPETKKAQLKKFGNSLRDNDNVLMIVK